ncbi:MAG: ABC transporter ATP-binding protein [Spirochaetes bacterium]|nr:ABC transporter ATP-binding protein [Spirochaetota bacterium]
MNTILEVQGLVKHFPGVKAVDGISFAIPRGTCYGLLGPNGAGKTTTIEMIEGILTPTSGEILYKGRRMGRGDFDELGVQLQNTELPQYLTVRETVAMFRRLYSRRARMDWLIETCRLGDILERDNRKISGGQKQRLLLAMALANDPELVFLDEPTTGLDPQARRHLWEIVRDMKTDGKTVVLTTHYMEEAQILCDDLAIMDYGKIIAGGSPAALLDRHRGGVTVMLSGIADHGIFQSLPWRWRVDDGRVEIHTDSLNRCMRDLLGLGVDLSSMTVRSWNLEDLFLELTGHELRG